MTISQSITFTHKTLFSDVLSQRPRDKVMCAGYLEEARRYFNLSYASVIQKAQNGNFDFWDARENVMVTGVYLCRRGMGPAGMKRRGKLLQSPCKLSDTSKHIRMRTIIMQRQLQ
jgi:hypothetical protein